MIHVIKDDMLSVNDHLILLDPAGNPDKSPVVIIIWRKFLTKPFIQKLYFLFFKILA